MSIKATSLKSHISSLKSPKKWIKGRVLYASKDLLIKSYQNKLFKSTDAANSWEAFLDFSEMNLLDKVKMRSHLLSRLFRFGVHHLTVDHSGNMGVIYNKKIGVIKENKLTQISDLLHSRPMSLESFQDDFLFGEYRNNAERSPIAVYSFNLKDKLKSKFLFKSIRHVHGVYKDPYTNLIWITTGDEDSEAAIYRTTATFEPMEKVLSGSQQTRAIKLLFDKDYIYFGSDAPDEVNFIYKMNKITLKVKKLQKVGSSVFHGCKVGDWLFFSTAIESSRVNKTRHSEVWASPNGDDWKCILKFKKDLLSMKLFQYGQIFFPICTQEANALWVSPFGAQNTNKSFMISISSVEDLFLKGG